VPPLEAEKLIDRTIVIDSGSENAQDALAWELNSHARALRDLGRLDEAASEAERGYAGPGNPAILLSLETRSASATHCRGRPSRGRPAQGL
jgi:hypothetical protein